MTDAECWLDSPWAIESIRMRVQHGGGLCLNEHTIHRLEMDLHTDRFWLTCGEETFASSIWSSVHDEGGVQIWAQSRMAEHRARVAEQLVIALLDRALS